MDWIRGKRLGHGNFAAVSLAIRTGHGHGHGHHCRFPPFMAVKSSGAAQAAFLLNEKLILDELRGCPEVVRCFGDCFSRENGEELYNVLLEYAAGGNMADRVRNSAGRGLPESEVRRYSRDLLRGLRYVHRLGYVHCDVKLQNILLCDNGGAKIADFGLARRAGGCELRGTPMYMSPEMVAGGVQGAPSDVWALGCAVLEMAAGSPAWGSSGGVAGLLMRIGDGEAAPEIPGALSDEGKDFLRKCFVKDPRDRWTAEMLLRHPFVCGQDDFREYHTDDATVQSSTADEVSPRCPFEFSDWASPTWSSTTSLTSPAWSPESGSCEPARLFSIPAAERVRRLDSGQSPNWSVIDDWVTVR